MVYGAVCGASPAPAFSKIYREGRKFFNNLVLTDGLLYIS